MVRGRIIGGNLISRRRTAPAGDEFLAFEGADNNEASVADFTIVDLLTVSGLSIPKDKYVFVTVQWRTSEITNNVDATLGLKINATNIGDPIIINYAQNFDESNIASWWIGPREAAYLISRNWASAASRAVAGAGYAIHPQIGVGAGINVDHETLSFDNGTPPDEVITSIAVRGQVGSVGGEMTLFVRNMRVHTLPTS